MSDMIEFTYVDIEDLVKSLEDQTNHIKFDYIVGISRGGLVPAVMLSHRLNLPLVPITWSTRDFTKQEHNLSVAQDLWAGKNILLVDDINDSGKTFLDLVEDWKYTNESKGRLIKVSVLQRYTTTYPSDYFGKLIESDNWVLFPWELK
jgi:hypoxanthine phosphoribosyltransferase